MKRLNLALASLVLVTAVTALPMTSEEIFEREKGKPDSRCPEEDDPDRPVHLSHPTDCTVFYKCYLGRAYLMDCPRAMKWNETVDMCDEKIGPCKIPVLYNSIPIKKASNALPEVSEVIKCPSVDDPEHQVYFSHPFECNKFFMCSNGHPWLHECPGALHWSVETDQCERPEDAKCQE